MNLFDSLLENNSIFSDESKLDMNYIPDKLPHREKELKMLSHLFVILLKRPNSISRKILITGKTGIGKTVTLKYFGELLQKAMKDRNMNLNYIHINCRKQRTSYKTLVMIVRAINKSIPKRGYSLQDLLDILIDLINGQDTHLLVVLDELNYIIEKDEDLLYYLTRINDDSLNKPQRLSIVGIIRDISCVNNLDQSTLSTLQRNIIKFNNYDKDQIFDILKYRAGLSFKKNVISNEIIEIVSEIVYSKGDLRFGLNLLWKAGKIAEGQNLKKITAECIRQANQDSFYFVPVDLIEDIPKKRLIFLLAIVVELETQTRPYVSFSDSLKTYEALCEINQLERLSNSQLWNYLNIFKRENIISTKILSKNVRGRMTLIEIPNFPLKKLKKHIITELDSKGIAF